MSRTQALRTFVFAGLLPIIAFTVIEEYFGVAWGIVAGMAFGVGEILWEKRTQGRVDPMTWGGNALILVLGAVSLWSADGIWFKLQPAILESVMALVLMGSWVAGRPMLRALALKQAKTQALIPQAEAWLSGLTLRTGVFFIVQAGLAAWAAIHWSTEAWAALKGIGFTLSLAVYMVVEVLLFRYRFAIQNYERSSQLDRENSEVLYQNVRMPDERGGLRADERPPGRARDDRGGKS